MRWFIYFAVGALAMAMLGCSKQSPPQSQSGAIHVSAPPPRTEPYLFMVILTNSQPPPMGALIAMSKSMKYEWHKVGSDGTHGTARGTIPSEICDAAVAEWKMMSGRGSVDSTREQAVYVGPDDGAHPPQ